ncbi:MAG: alpha/beta fold hydrolase [Pseudomonadota bacterium]
MRSWLVGYLLLILSLAPARAGEVRLVAEGGRQLLADFRPGRADAPALLILHGFLVTASFPAIQALASEFSGKGYTVLAPTLSLGISGRRAGLGCDAIHMHAHDDDLAEVARWVDWLAGRVQGPIVLVGHSFGGAQALAYIARAPNPRVAAMVGVSLSYVGARGEEVWPDELARAEAFRASGKRDLGRFHLIYCHGNYVAPAGSYLSYASLTRERVLALSAQARAPVVAIMGGEDQRFGADWVEAMRRAGITVRQVPGASHFFDGSHEFDLLDAVDSALRDLRITP